MKKSFWLLCLIMHSTQTFSQDPFARDLIIKDSKSENSIPYASMSILNKNIGEVGDELGKINVVKFKTFLDDSVLISCVGYESLKVPIKEILSSQNIFLNKKSYSLKEINIVSKEIKTEKVVLGIKRAMLVGGVSYNSESGSEISLLMENTRKGVLKKAKIFIAENETNHFAMRLLFYEEGNDGKPGKLANLKDTIFYIPKIKGWINIDLSDQNLWVNGNFFMAVQWLSPSFNKEKALPLVGVKSNSKSSNSWYRMSPDGAWTSSSQDPVLQVELAVYE